MSAKILVIAVFAVWSAICWNWYVCGIKEACGERPAAPAARIEPAEPIIVPDTATFDTKPETPSPQTATTLEYEGLDKERLQIVDKKDHVVIHFPYQSTQKEENAAMDAYLSELAQQLIDSGRKISLEGHTDFVGGSAYNYQLGLKRARNIRDLLIKKGVPAKQISYRSHGDKKPAATNDTPEGRYRNRRVEIRTIR